MTDRDKSSYRHQFFDPVAQSTVSISRWAGNDCAVITSTSTSNAIYLDNHQVERFIVAVAANSGYMVGEDENDPGCLTERQQFLAEFVEAVRTGH